MKVFAKVTELQAHIHELRQSGVSVGFVPTMGALHAGHAKLIKSSAQHHKQTVVSIFVNPTQFGPNEDYSQYPRTFAEDKELAQASGASILFVPSVAEMYPDGFATNISMSSFTNALCAASRPGHFEGVCTVVLKLLNIVMPTVSYFGMKDFQQLKVIEKLCFDVNHPTHVEGIPTVREHDGLALSSRNRFLTVESRIKALCIPRALKAAATLFAQGERDPAALISSAKEHLESISTSLDYLELLDTKNFERPASSNYKETVLAVAAFFPSSNGKTRLIDNVVLNESNSASISNILDTLIPN